MKRLLIFLIFSFGFSPTSFSQIYTNQYRTPGQDWQQLNTEHFRIIYPAGAEEEARRAGRILELQYPLVRQSIGGSLSGFPFILNSLNDRSNGFVSPINFRSEIELPPIKGKSMNPRSGNWLEMVLPHELVHALHLNVNPPSLTSAIGLFSPDLRRAVHMAAPLGIHEGVAVEHESHRVMEDGGRGNHPWFVNRFNSGFVSGDPWSMGQLFHISASTLPFDRHYLGSYEFTRWLHNRYGEETLSDAIEFHYKWPFLGFGIALKHTTGTWPGSLYRSFSRDMEAREQERLNTIGESTTGASFFPDHGKRGPVIRRPLWLDEQTLLMHGTFYNSPTGFYTYDLSGQDYRLLLEHRSVEDFRFSVDIRSDELYFADYRTDGRYDNTFRSNLFRYNLKRDEKSKVTPEERLFAPSPGSPFLALQTFGSANRLVSVNPDDGSLQVVAQLNATGTIEEAQQHTAHKNLLAVIARKGNIQALWVGRPDYIQQALEDPPEVVFRDGSIFDLHWHPEQKKLLFTSDHTGTLNIYEYNHSDGGVWQVTRSLYNALEASYSPDGDRIAYVLQEQSEFHPAILERIHFLGRELPDEEWKPTAEKTAPMDRPLLDVEGQPDESEWETEPYRSWRSWLRPRSVLPVYREVASGTREAGVVFSSADPLNRHTYSMAATRLQQRFWFDLNYRYTGFHPGFGFDLFDRPGFQFLRGADEELPDTVRFLLQERGATLRIPFIYEFERNTRLTSLRLIPEYRISQVRFFLPGNPDIPLTGFGTLHTASLSAVLNYRLRQFRRDFQPNSGWVFFAQTDYDLNDLTFRFEANDDSFRNTFIDRKGLRAGLVRYLAPLARWNQSLRIGAQVLTQTDIGPYNAQNIVSNAFDEAVFPAANNLFFFNTRYTVPLAYPDDGGLLIPAYLSNFYLAFFSQTVGDLDRRGAQGIAAGSRTALGAGLRANIRLSNFLIDIGIAFGYEPSRDQWRFIVGQF